MPTATTKRTKLDVELDELETAVSENPSAIDAGKDLLNKIAILMVDAEPDSAKIRNIANSLTKRAESIAHAIITNTPYDLPVDPPPPSKMLVKDTKE